MGLISCANFVIAGVDGVIHQRDFTSVKINANITLIIVPMDVTYNTHQSWFAANILENKYNLLFYWHFSVWEIICINGVRDSLKEYSLLGEAVDTVSVHVGMLKKNITRVWKKSPHWYGSYWVCFGNIHFPWCFKKARDLQFYKRTTFYSIQTNK